MSNDHSSLVSVGAELACYPWTGATSCDPAISPYVWDEDRAWDAAADALCAPRAECPRSTTPHRPIVKHV